MEVIREEMELIRDRFGDERRTEITASSADINIEDLISGEDVVVTLSRGYVKYQPRRITKRNVVVGKVEPRAY